MPFRALLDYRLVRSNWPSVSDGDDSWAVAFRPVTAGKLRWMLEPLSFGQFSMDGLWSTGIFSMARIYPAFSLNKSQR
jgi:hypothetical protein